MTKKLNTNIYKNIPINMQIYTEIKHKYINSVPTNAYIDKLDEIDNKYHNIYHSTIKMKSVDVKSGTYLAFDMENWCRF